jgi:hypothetical protein
MHYVTTEAMLAAWELGLSQRSARRTLTMLSVNNPDLTIEQLMKLPIGQRDGLLIELREALFGLNVNSMSECPFCHEQLELTLDLNNIRVINSDATKLPLKMAIENYMIEFRLPDSSDILFIESLSNIEEARAAMFNRCLMAISTSSNKKNKVTQACTAEDLSPEILAKVEDAMAEADPQAEVKLDLSCPSCQQRWLATFDIASFLWAEVNAWAERLLNEVHLLARAYAWKEHDILAMSATRRQYYLSRIAQ